MASLDNTVTFTLNVSIAWWLTPYFYLLATMCAITGREPNYDRVNYWIGKAVKVKAAR
jgi:hypothetical protein